MSNPGDAPDVDPGQTTAADPGLPRTAIPDDPQWIGRYRIETVLGEGGFGRVYLAHDDQLHRLVAIKVPRPDRLSRPQDAEVYLAEARVVASLDHSHIVPVFDVGTTEEGLCYVVSKFIEGSDLAHKISQTRFSCEEAADLVATVAEALHYAHRKKLVHRDIKPANILIDMNAKPYVADFGLALKEANFGRGAGVAGTPCYMSPEQARGEGHRVDGRSDIFSLGVIFYELLTGRRPFGGESVSELLEQVKNVDARPPRQIDDTIPRELERICLKTLSKRASERYTTAKDLGDDLRHFLSQTVENNKVTAQASANTAASSTPVPFPTPTPSLAVTPTSDQRPIKIVPKGLRSFDAHDADFFLELLPGPRDRDGLPDSIRFWKTRIEEMDPDNTFSVGLIYGPSGCGKSSLVKAGLLPRLLSSVVPIYVEATGEETEARLLKGLRKHCPDLPAHLDLIETLTALRRERFVPPGKKVLLVLDQFEQWLHAKKEQENTELVQALRQCDGGRLQCLVMVRDDFWMAATRFMRELEIRLLEGQNSAAIDLFPTRHAEKVLLAFGRAFSVLPDTSTGVSKDQKQFLEQAVSGLAQEGKVICVRLALFAEMMKGKSWVPATLKEVGGTAGVGVTFLEETFSAASAPPEHRYHQKAARTVLQALLPESGTDIKGHMRSHAELLAASGYENRPRDFEHLVHILDSEIRLITPTDPEGKDPGEPGGISPRVPGERFFQLTHDYLVPSLRDWLTRKQKETRHGRAELLLADYAGVWNARSENRQLPSLLQLLQIRWLTTKKNWTPPQRKMMSRASRVHSLRVLAVALVLALLGWGAYEGHGRLQAQALRDRLLDANTAEVPTILKVMTPYRHWLDPLLQHAYQDAKASNDPRKELHASLALLPVDATQVRYLADRLLDAEPHEVPVIRDALAPYKEELLDKLWAVAENPRKSKESQRLRAAAALAKYDPESARWAKIQDAVANDLVTVPTVYLGAWLESLRSVRARLWTPLAGIFRDAARRDAERSLVTDILADYAADQPQVLADLLMDADEKQFAVIYPKFREQSERGLPLLTSEIDRKLPAELASSDERREKLAKRQANAAVALLRMNQPEKVWPLFQHSPDPRVRSYLIHWLSPRGADGKAIVKQLHEQKELTIRRALLLGLGEFDEKDFPSTERKALLPKLRDIYLTDADPGLHASTEWLLRTWKEEGWLRQTNEAWAKNKEQRQQRLEGIKQTLAKDKEKTLPQWYVNGQGQTMVVIPAPVTFLMGSPLTELNRQPDEPQHLRRIRRTFALAAKSVTVEQYRQVDKRYILPVDYTYTTDLPVVGIGWHTAARYCNWLSNEEGIPADQWCYEIKDDEIKLKANYLSLTGYRLPQEAELEYAMRAGAVTSRFFGETQDLLPKYAWYVKNSEEKTWPVGSLKPNDLGFFDVPGNVYNWCQERYKPYPSIKEGEVSEDREEDLVIDGKSARVLRGGSFRNTVSFMRSADRLNIVPTTATYWFGLRPARTFLP